MKERPILFSGPMVRAIFVGRKRQTRREIKPGVSYGCPYGKPGDRLWVRETWQYFDWTEDGQPFVRYAADQATRLCSPSEDWAERVEEVWAGLSGEEGPARDKKWRPSIFMPRWASRITVEIVSVRYEPLSEISEEDADAEGADTPGVADIIQVAWSKRDAFAKLWQSINGPNTFDNRWVWVVEFKVLEGQG